MNVTMIGCVAAIAVASSIADAQSMFRGNAEHAGVYSGAVPRQFHRVKWTFQTGDRIVSSPVYSDGTIFFGSDDGNVYAVGAADGRQRWQRRTGGPVASTPAIAGGILYVGSYDGKLYALDARTGKVQWKFATGGERRFEAKGLHGLQPKSQTIADPYDVYLSSPVVAAGIVYFGSGEDPAIHNQVGFQSSPAVVNGVVYTGCRDSNLYALDARTGQEKWRVGNAGSWVVGSPAVVGSRVVYATSDSSLYHVVDAETGKSLVRQQGKAFMFSSPAVVGSVVLIGVLNGTLEARDTESGELLWEFATDASKRNDGWVLTADRKFNAPLLFRSSWREAPIVATDAQWSVGSIFSSPLIVDGVVHFGSADGNLYALE